MNAKSVTPDDRCADPVGARMRAMLAGSSGPKTTRSQSRDGVRPSQLREMAGMALGNAAGAIGTSMKHLARVESGEVTPTGAWVGRASATCADRLKASTPQAVA